MFFISNKKQRIYLICEWNTGKILMVKSSLCIVTRNIDKMYIKFSFVILILLVVIQFIDSIRDQNAVKKQSDSSDDYRRTLYSSRISPKCGPGERVDADGICRYIYK